MFAKDNMNKQYRKQTVRYIRRRVSPLGGEVVVEDTTVEEAAEGGGTLAVIDTTEGLGDLLEAFEDLPAGAYPIGSSSMAFIRKTYSCNRTSRGAYQMHIKKKDEIGSGEQTYRR